jgi:DNA repair protein RadC
LEARASSLRTTIRAATRRLASAAEAIDCTILDHLVFAGTECTSFRRVGLL